MRKAVQDYCTHCFHDLTHQVNVGKIVINVTWSHKPCSEKSKFKTPSLLLVTNSQNAPKRSQTAK